MKNVAVLFGGQSSEYGVSLHSVASVFNNFPNKYNVIRIGITKNGDWLLVADSTTPEDIENDDWQKGSESCVLTNKGILNLKTNQIVNVDVVFPVMHGQYVEDGKLQGMLEMCNIPYIGCGVQASANCMDKNLAHMIVKQAGIKVPESKVFTNPETEVVEQFVDDIGYPVFVKPLRAGSSFGISKVNNKEELEPAIQEAVKYDTTIIVEQNIEGFEVGNAVMGSGEYITQGEVDEIELTDGFFDFNAKYSDGLSIIHMPARLSKTERNRIRKVAKKIYQALGCEGLARVDCFYTPDKEIVFNEVNTLPGFTSHSRFPCMMAGAGYDFTTVIDNLIKEKLF